MIRFLLWIAWLTLLGAGMAWVAEHPGQVTISWLDRRIDTSLAFLLAVFTGSSLLAAYAYVMLRYLALAPDRLWRRRRWHRYEQGISELTSGIAALAAGDTQGAQAHARKAQKQMGDSPLMLLVSAQIAKSRGEEPQTQALLERMLEHKETEYLAARSLSGQASQVKNFPRALRLAQRASAVNPRGKAAAFAVVSLHAKLGEWQQALAALDKMGKKARFKRSDILRGRALIHAGQGMSLLEAGKAQEAMSHAKAAYRFAPDFTPACLLMARSHAACGREAEALKVILRAWRKAPHPELAAQWRTLMDREPREKQLKQVRKLAALHPQHNESDFAVAETAIRQQAWQDARAALASAMARRETVRACKLMALLEQRALSDFEGAGRWLAKSAEAPADPAWQCSLCAKVTESWSAHCPACGEMDTLRWGNA